MLVVRLVVHRRSGNELAARENKTSQSEDHEPIACGERMELFTRHVYQRCDAGAWEVCCAQLATLQTAVRRRLPSPRRNRRGGDERMGRVGLQ